MSRRVVVTGMGAITPIGLSVEEFWQSVKEGKIGFGEITKFDTEGYKCHLAAEVKDFDAKQYMDAKAARRMELFCQYAVAAAKEAITDAALDMEKKILTVSVYLSETESEVLGELSVSIKDCWKRTVQSKSAVRTACHFQYGSRKCLDRIRFKRKEHQRGNGMRNRNKQYR